MPGNWDIHTTSTASTLGQPIAGSKEGKAWKDGYEYRYSGTAVSVPITNNPFSDTQSPAEKLQWDNGWQTANDNSGGVRYGPNVPSGAPPA